MGLTFKENCPDLRNTRVVDVINDLKEFNANIDVFDPWVSKEEAEVEYGISLVGQPETNTYDAVIVAVAHNDFKKMGIDAIRSFTKTESIIFDVKYLFSDHPDIHCL